MILMMIPMMIPMVAFISGTPPSATEASLPEGALPNRLAEVSGKGPGGHVLQIHCGIHVAPVIPLEGVLEIETELQCEPLFQLEFLADGEAGVDAALRVKRALARAAKLVLSRVGEIGQAGDGRVLVALWLPSLKRSPPRSCQSLRRAGVPSRLGRP